MANIIIPAEHQSAPKEAPLATRGLPAAPQFTVSDRRRVTEAGDERPSWERYDEEMDLPLPKKLEAQVEEFEKKVLTRSPEETVESALREYETNYRREEVKAQRWAGQARWQGRENEQMRLVRIWHPHTYIRNLQLAGINAQLDDPYERYRQAGWDVRFWPKCNYRLWLNSFSKAGRIGVTAWLEGKPTTVSTLQYPYAPEWSLMRFDKYNVPTNERYRGWRTTTLALIVAGVLTEAEAQRAFGEARGEASLFYREQLYLHRRIRLGLEKR